MRRCKKVFGLRCSSLLVSKRSTSKALSGISFTNRKSKLNSSSRSSDNEFQLLWSLRRKAPSDNCAVACRQINAKRRDTNFFTMQNEGFLGILTTQRVGNEALLFVFLFKRKIKRYPTNWAHNVTLKESNAFSHYFFTVFRAICCAAKNFYSRIFFAQTALAMKI